MYPDLLLHGEQPSPHRKMQASLLTSCLLVRVTAALPSYSTDAGCRWGGQRQTIQGSLVDWGLCRACCVRDKLSMKLFPSHWDCHLGSPTTFESASSIRPCVPVPCGSPQNADSRTVGLKPSPLRFCSAVTLPGRRCHGFQNALGTARKDLRTLRTQGIRAKGDT